MVVLLEKIKKNSKQWLFTYSLILIGAVIMSAGYVFFISPHKIVPGGVYGIGILLHHLTKGVFAFAPSGLPIGLVGLALNIPLTIAGIKILGPKFGMLTIIGYFSSSFSMDFINEFFWKDKILIDDVLLSSIFGAVLIGVGLTIIFKTRATSGGSDIIAMIINKWTKIPIGQGLIYVDSTIVLLAILAFNDWKIPLYSWLVIFISGKVIDGLIEGANYQKALLIISDKSDEIKLKIIDEVGCGATLIKGEGAYNKNNKNIIYTVVSRREVSYIKNHIYEIDKNAFITVISASEVVGEGFKKLEKD